MKKYLLVLTLITGLIITTAGFASTDKNTLSEEYLKNTCHIAIMNPLANRVAQKIIKQVLKKQAKGKYKVKFRGYTLESTKNGIFKYLEISGKNININEITLPYINMKSVTDYNWIDYKQDPVIIKSDMVFDYEMRLTENTLNEALQTEDYQKEIQKINRLTYPLITITNVSAQITNNKIRIIAEYNFPIFPAKRNKTLKITSGLCVTDGKINMTDVNSESVSDALLSDKINNLTSMLNPLSFTLKLIDNSNCEGKIENIKIVDDIIIINGKIYLKGVSS